MPGKHPRRRTAKVTARMERTYQQHIRGWSTYRIAEREGVDQSQIARDLAKMRDRLADRDAKAEEHAEAAKFDAIATYQEVKAQAFAEWERSKGQKTRHREKVRQQPDKPAKSKPGEHLKPAQTIETTEAEQATEDQFGDPQYLQVVVKAQKEMDQLNGLVKQTISLDLAERMWTVIQGLQADGHDI